jgi:hypothetical protein
MVAGKSIILDAVKAFIVPADLVIAHDAKFEPLLLALPSADRQGQRNCFSRCLWASN